MKSGERAIGTSVGEEGDHPINWDISHTFMRSSLAFIMAGAGTYLAVILLFANGQEVRAALALAYMAVAAVTWLLLARGRVRAAVWVLGVGLWVFMSGAAIFLGGVASTSTTIYPLIILLAGWAVGPRVAVMVTLTTVAFLLFLAYAESQAWLPAAPLTLPLMRWIVQATVFSLTALLVGHFVHAYRDRLAEVRSLGDSLAQRAAELAELNATLETRVRERTAALEQANQELESFSYTISHDLRSPLRSMVGFAGLLGENMHEKLDDESRAYLARIDAGGNKMSRLIDGVLDYSRLARSAPVRREVDLDVLVAEIVAELRLPYPASEIVQSPLGKADADPTMMRQIFHNLIDNGLKYSLKNPHAVVEIGVRRTSAGIEYFVRDNGVGFDMQYGGQLFKLFNRLHSDADFEGTGAGLAIVKRLVERHGGSIRAEAQPGQGAIFFFKV